MNKGNGTRRNFLKASLATCISTSSLSSLAIAQDSQTEEEIIFSQVRSLTLNSPETLTILFPKGSLDNLRTIASAFEAATNVKITFLEAPLDDINAQVLLASLTSKTSFDIALPATFGIPDLAQAGAIYNLDDLAQKYAPKNFQKNSLYSLGDYYKGSLYGYQTDGDAYLMFYNKTFLENNRYQDEYEERYGQTLILPRTWEELDRLIQFFHRPEDGLYGGSLFRTINYLPWEWWIRFHAKGYFPFAQDMTPQVNNEAGIKALEELIEVSQYLDPRTKRDTLFENWQSFCEGKSFCNIGWGGSQKFFNKANIPIRNKMTFTQTPGGIFNGNPIEIPYFNWGWNYVVSAASTKPDLAYLFTLYACSSTPSTIAVSNEDGFFDPFHADHYDDPKIIQTYSKTFLKTHKKSMENAIPDLYLDGQSEYFGALKENLYKALNKNITPKQAMDRTARQWRITTFQRDKNSQSEQWAYLKSRYPRNLRSVLK